MLQFPTLLFSLYARWQSPLVIGVWSFGIASVQCRQGMLFEEISIVDLALDFSSVQVQRIIC